jgi:trehalose-6-phosphate synthase
VIQKCFHNPTFLYGSLENMIAKKQFNFKWIGLVTTLDPLTDHEQAELNKQFEEMNAYPIFLTVDEVNPYLLFYENILRPLFHNFQDLYNINDQYLDNWKDYLNVN